MMMEGKVDFAKGIDISIYRVPWVSCSCPRSPCPWGHDRHFSPSAGAAGAFLRFHSLHTSSGLPSAGHAVGGDQRVIEDRHHLHRYLLPDGAEDGGGYAPVPLVQNKRAGVRRRKTRSLVPTAVRLTLGEIKAVTPPAQLPAVIEPHYPKGNR